MDNENNDRAEKLTELIKKHLIVDVKCVICTTPVLGKKINIAHLEGMSYREMIEKFSDQFAKATGRAGINKKQLVKHFNEHFNVKGLDLASYLSVRDSNNDNKSSNQQQDNSELQNILDNHYVSDLDLIDAAVREQIRQLLELKQLAQEKKDAGRTFNLDNLIMKQQKIAKEIGSLATRKMAITSRVNLERSQSDYLKGLTFLTSKFSDTVDIAQLNVKIEDIYLRTVMTLLINKVNESLTRAIPDIDKATHILFLSNVKQSLGGIATEIDSKFRTQIEKMSENVKKLASQNKPLTIDDVNTASDVDYVDNVD